MNHPLQCGNRSFLYGMTGLVLLVLGGPWARAADVEIWDNGASAWTDTFANGDPIDNGTINSTGMPSMAVDSQGRMYVTYYQYDGSNLHVYLSRYDGTDVKIWDNDTSAWTDTFSDGDPIDTGTANTASSPQLAVDSQDRVYVTFIQLLGGYTRIYLSRFDGTDVMIWDNDASAWTDTFADGDPIDTGTANSAYATQLAVDSQDRVYVAFNQYDGSPNTHVYLSRYDGTDVKIWDNDASAWTDTFTDADPIDTGAAHRADNQQLAVDSSDRVYVTFSQLDGLQSHVYLSRYDGTNVKIWDNNASLWTNTFADGDPIDTGTANNIQSPQLALDSQDRVYVTYRQSDGTNWHIYLSRYDGMDAEIWDNGAAVWTDIFANGDPIDTGMANNAIDSQLAVDSSDRVYVTFSQSDGSQSHIYLSRYDGADVKIWDNGASAWTNTFADADPIDIGTANEAANSRLAVDVQDRVYVTFDQSDGSNNHCYLSRYNGTDVEIWDNGASAWTDTFTEGDPIDTGTADNAVHPQLALDSAGRVYVTLSQIRVSADRLYLSRFNVTVPQSLMTMSATSITATTAAGGGDITSDGGTNVTAHGVCWNTTGTPTTADSKTNDGTGAGSFSSNLTGLSANTTYYVRAYATNSVGTSYGSEISFTTDTVPTVTTTATSNIASATADSGGNVTSDGRDAVTARGVCWNTTGSPTTSDNKTADGTGAGSFSSSLSGLSPDTPYYIRAYATNSVGTAYGNEVSFTTPSIEIAPVDPACGACGIGSATAMACCLPMLMIARLLRRRSRGKKRGRDGA